MDPKPSSLLLLSLFLLFSSATSFNITKLLGQHPDFRTFNDYLTQTQLAAEINQRQTITILAVDNSALSSVSGKSTDVIKKVLSLHVVLDYYDVEKLQQLSNKTALLTTLFQASGSASAEQGFLNVTDLSTGVSFGSAVKGSTLGAKLVKSVAAQPYNISVLQISSVIIPTGIENSNSSSNSTSSPVATPKTSPTQAPSSSKVPPTGTPAKAPSAAPPKSVEAPAPSDDSSDAPSNADAPSDDADAPSDAPAGVDSPLSSPPSPSLADGPTGDASAPGPSAPSSSAGTRVDIGACLSVIIGVVSLSAL